MPPRRRWQPLVGSSWDRASAILTRVASAGGSARCSRSCKRMLTLPAALEIGQRGCRFWSTCPRSRMTLAYSPEAGRRTRVPTIAGRSSLNIILVSGATARARTLSARLATLDGRRISACCCAVPGHSRCCSTMSRCATRASINHPLLQAILPRRPAGRSAENAGGRRGHLNAMAVKLGRAAGADAASRRTGRAAGASSRGLKPQELPRRAEPG